LGIKWHGNQAAAICRSVVCREAVDASKHNGQDWRQNGCDFQTSRQASTTNKVTLRLRPYYTGPDNLFSGHSAGSLIFSLSSSYSDWLHGGCM
jgi:hypothetical protein